MPGLTLALRVLLDRKTGTTRQRKNKADQEAMEHEWAALTKAFLDNWRAATEECLAGKVHGKP